LLAVYFRFDAHLCESISARFVLCLFFVRRVFAFHGLVVTKKITIYASQFKRHHYRDHFDFRHFSTPRNLYLRPNKSISHPPFYQDTTNHYNQNFVVFVPVAVRGVGVLCYTLRSTPRASRETRGSPKAGLINARLGPNFLSILTLLLFLNIFPHQSASIQNYCTLRLSMP